MKKIIIILLWIIPTAVVKGQTGGNSVFTFLNLPVSSNAAAVGGYDISNCISGSNAVFSNPAQLNKDMHKNFSAGYIDYLADINRGAASYAYAVDSLKTFAAGIQYLHYGTFDQTGTAGENTGTFTCADYALAAGYSQQIFKHWRFGASLKIIYSELEIYKSWGILADLGVYYKDAESGLSAGAVIRNAGFQIKPYNQTRENPPFEISAGVSYLLAHAPIRASLTAIELQKPETDNNSSIGEDIANHFVVALEFFPESAVSLKTGCNIQRRNYLKTMENGMFSGMSIGIDIRLRRFAVEYSRQCFNAAGSTNLFSVELFINKFGTR